MSETEREHESDEHKVAMEHYAKTLNRKATLRDLLLVGLIVAPIVTLALLVSLANESALLTSATGLIGAVTTRYIRLSISRLSELEPWHDALLTLIVMVCSFMFTVALAAFTGVEDYFIIPEGAPSESPSPKYGEPPEVM